jgi:hypothetical protein
MRLFGISNLPSGAELATEVQRHDLQYSSATTNVRIGHRGAEILSL